MKRSIFIAIFLMGIVCSVTPQLSNPNITPIPIDCWGLDQNSISLLSPFYIQHYTCLEAPSVGSMIVSGNKEVDLRAGKEIHLKPGFTVSNLTGNGKFHASLEKEQVGVVVFTPTTEGQVAKCEKLELGINLPQDIKIQIENYFNGIPHDDINPFDPDQISIEAIFTTYAPSNENLVYDYANVINFPMSPFIGEQRRSYGFYYEEFHTDNTVYPDGNWISDTTSFNFRIRFAPTQVGLWRTDIVIKINNQVLYDIKPIYFKCTPSNCPGYITGGETTSDNRHFIFENGDAFFGIGQDIAWPDKSSSVVPPGYNWPRQQAPAGFEEQREFIENLSYNGGNLVRMINTEWTDALEWEKLGDYKKSMAFAWENDRTFDFLKEKEVYVLWCMQMHTALQSTASPDGQHWEDNPYHLSLGIALPESFFTNSTAVMYFKKRCRYMLARWGYSPQIAALQPLSEINECTETPNSSPYFDDPIVRYNVNDWFCNLKLYIQQDLGYNFNVGTSFTSSLEGIADGNLAMTCADFIDWHPYSDGRNRNIDFRWTGINGTNSGYKIFTNYNKPVILGENGLHGYQLYNCGEEDWHNDIWASAMMGGWATALPWYLWKGEHNTRQNFNYLRTFFDTYIDFKNIEWEPRRWPEDAADINQVDYDKRRDNFFEVLYMTGDPDFLNDKRAFGWVHNRSSYWYNKKGTCEDNAISLANNNTDPDDNIPDPPDDDDSFSAETLQSGASNIKNRKIRLANLSLVQRYDIDWFDPYTGLHLATTDETHGFLGKLRVTLPDNINTTQYRDLLFLLRPKNSSFMNPFETIWVDKANDANLEFDQNKLLQNENYLPEKTDTEKILIYPNPTSSSIEITSSEMMENIQIFNYVGEKVFDFLVMNKTSSISFNGLPKGIYTIKILYESKIKTYKIVYQ